MTDNDQNHVFSVDDNTRVRVLRNEVPIHPWDTRYSPKQTRITWWGDDGSWESPTCKHLTRRRFDNLCAKKDIVAFGLRTFDRYGGLRSREFTGHEDGWAEGVLFIELKDGIDRKQAIKILKQDAAILNAYTYGSVYDVLIETKCPQANCNAWHLVDVIGQIVWSGDTVKDGGAKGDKDFWNEILPFLKEHLSKEQISTVKEAFTLVR